MTTKIFSPRWISSLLVALMLITSSLQIKISKTKCEACSKGSWNDYLNAYLINYVDQTNGKSYLNASSGAAIIGSNDGVVWASSSGFSLRKYTVTLETDDGSTQDVSIDEFDNLKAAFNNNGVSTRKGGIRLNKDKYFVVSYNADSQVMYLKTNGGGAAVAKSHQAFIIATFKTSSKMTVKTRTSTTTQSQNPGTTNLGVEKLQQFLNENNL